MKTTRMKTLLALGLVAGFMALTQAATAASANPVRRGNLHLIKIAPAKRAIPVPTA